MREPAVTPTIADGSPEPEFHASLRERLGLAAFIVVAAVATAAWLALLVWGVVKVANAF